MIIKTVEKLQISGKYLNSLKDDYKSYLKMQYQNEFGFMPDL